LKRVYLDHNATTPVRPEVARAVQPFLGEIYGNPSSLHAVGREARARMEESRGKVAAFFRCRPDEVVFTGSGTEGDNLALKGVMFSPGNAGRHVVTTAVEHPAVRKSASFLRETGFPVTIVPVGADGIADPDAVARAIRPDTAVVSVMLANNETGAINDVAAIGAICREKGVLFHTDAVQAAGKVPIDFSSLPVDMLTFSAHKVNALKGSGGLLVRKGLRLVPLMCGGHHERGIRGGTENLAAIAAMGTAFSLLETEMEEESRRIAALRDRFEARVFAKVPDVVRNGAVSPRLPNTSNLTFRHVEGEALLIGLDALGVCCSSGSACSSGDVEPSAVLLAMGIPPEDARAALRFSLGYGNTEEEIDYAADAIAETVAKFRAMSPLWKV
jgi:cysteine desulfurase